MGTNKTNLLKQREEYLKSQEEARQERIIRRRERMIEHITNVFNDDKLDEIIIDGLIKNGLMYVHVGLSLSGEHGFEDGYTIFNILDENKVFDKYKEQGINVKFNKMKYYEYFEFKLGEITSDTSHAIYKVEGNEEYKIEVLR